MNTQYSFIREVVISISLTFCFSVVADLAHAQPTQKDIDALNALAKKMPTPEQSSALTKISNENTKNHEPLSAEFNKLAAEIERATRGPGYLITKAHVQAAMGNHKKLRALYVEQLNAITAWGRQSGRMNCVRQAEKTRLYVVRVSDQWLNKVAALPLSTVEDRLYAGQHVMAGGGTRLFNLIRKFQQTLVFGQPTRS